MTNVQYTNVVGLSFREFTDDFTDDQMVILVAEPDNQFDADAVAVMINDKVLGYLPRTFEFRAEAAKVGTGTVIKTKRYHLDSGNPLGWEDIKHNQITQLVIAIELPL